MLIKQSHEHLLSSSAGDVFDDLQSTTKFCFLFRALFIKKMVVLGVKTLNTDDMSKNRQGNCVCVCMQI